MKAAVAHNLSFSAACYRRAACRLMEACRSEWYAETAAVRQSQDGCVVARPPQHASPFGISAVAVAIVASREWLHEPCVVVLMSHEVSVSERAW